MEDQYQHESDAFVYREDLLREVSGPECYVKVLVHNLVVHKSCPEAQLVQDEHCTEVTFLFWKLSGLQERHLSLLVPNGLSKNQSWDQEANWVNEKKDGNELVILHLVKTTN